MGGTYPTSGAFLTYKRGSHIYKRGVTTLQETKFTYKCAIHTYRK